jgi:hypothetical protein
LVVLIAALLAGCGGSPRSRAKEFGGYLPREVGDWTRNDDDTVELLGSTVTNIGHIIMTYEGPDDALAYVVIQAQPSVDAAEVAYKDRVRNLSLQGLVFDRDRQPPKATADVAQQGRARYALFQEDGLMVEINTLAAAEDTPVSDDAFDSLLSMVRDAYDKILEE